MSYKIGSFNLRNIGFKSLEKSQDRNPQLIAKIIKDEGFDVVALQEVINEGTAFTHPEAEYIKKSILFELGNDWDFKWAEAKNEKSISEDKRGEGYAFLWKKSRLKLSEVLLSNGKTRVFSPRMCSINKKDIIRKPYYARFTPSGTREGGPWIELRLLCIHTYYGDDRKESREKRKKEIMTLLKDIYPQISDRRYGEYGNGMPSYTILMGDYNAELLTSWKKQAHIEQNSGNPLYISEEFPFDTVEITEWGDKRYIKTVQYEFTTLKSKATLEKEEFDGNGYAHDYDHFSYEEKQFEGVYIKARRVDAVKTYCGQDYKKYYDQVSDHVPIMMEISFDIDLDGGVLPWKEKKNF